MDEGWEVIRIVGTDEEASLIAGFLDSQGVPARVESLLFHQEPVTFGHLGEVRIRVPGERADEARRLLAERDAPDVDAGAPEGWDASPRDASDDAPDPASDPSGDDG